MTTHGQPGPKPFVFGAKKSSSTSSTPEKQQTFDSLEEQDQDQKQGTSLGSPGPARATAKDRHREAEGRPLSSEAARAFKNPFATTVEKFDRIGNVMEPFNIIGSSTESENPPSSLFGNQRPSDSEAAIRPSEKHGQPGAIFGVFGVPRPSTPSISKAPSSNSPNDPSTPSGHPPPAQTPEGLFSASTNSNKQNKHGREGAVSGQRKIRRLPAHSRKDPPSIFDLPPRQSGINLFDGLNPSNHGQTPSAPSVGTSLFGGTPHVPASGLFGSSTSAQISAGLFGPSAPRASDGLFVSSTAAQASNDLFGTTTPAQTSGSLFGASALAQASDGLFGAATPAQTFGGLFGSSATAQASRGLFGTTTPTQTSGGLFGASVPAQTSGGLFGASTPAQASSRLFGTTTPAQTSGSLFGAPSQASRGLFGASAPTQTSGGLFGASAPARASSNIFGSLKPAQTSEGIFGALRPAPTSGGLFGASAPTRTSGTDEAGSPSKLSSQDLQSKADDAWTQQQSNIQLALSSIQDAQAHGQEAQNSFRQERNQWQDQIRHLEKKLEAKQAQIVAISKQIEKTNEQANEQVQKIKRHFSGSGRPPLETFNEDEWFFDCAANRKFGAMYALLRRIFCGEIHPKDFHEAINPEDVWYDPFNLSLKREVLLKDGHIYLRKSEGPSVAPDWKIPAAPQAEKIQTEITDSFTKNAHPEASLSDNKDKPSASNVVSEPAASGNGSKRKPAKDPMGKIIKGRHGRIMSLGPIASQTDEIPSLTKLSEASRTESAKALADLTPTDGNNNHIKPTHIRSRSDSTPVPVRDKRSSSARPIGKEENVSMRQTSTPTIRPLIKEEWLTNEQRVSRIRKEEDETVERAMLRKRQQKGQ